MDKARFKKVFAQSLYIHVIGAVGGMIAGAIIYFCWSSYANPKTVYEAFTEYYVDFAWNENTQTAYDYYNAYTWNDIIATDAVLDRAIESMGEEAPDKAYFRNAINADLPSDIRVIHTLVKDNDSVKCEKLRTALENAIISFGKDMEEFREIRVIRRDEVKPEEVKDRLLTAILTGFASGLVFSFFMFLILYCLDDRVIMPSDIRIAVPQIPCLGGGEIARSNIDALKEKHPGLREVELDKNSCRDASFVDKINITGDSCPVIAALPIKGKNALRHEDLTAAADTLKLRGVELLGVYLKSE